MMPNRSVCRPLLFLASVVFLAGCQTARVDSPDGWIARMHNTKPTKSTIYVCHSFGCKLKYGFHVSDTARKQLAAILGKGSTSPEAERHAIGKAVQWFETSVGPLIGSDKDKGGLDMVNSGTPGQMDCIDEASNTNALMIFAQMHGMLKYHQVHSPVARGYFLDGRYPHATAVVTETKTGKRFAVDSWVHDNGEFPEIKPLSVWMAEFPWNRDR